MKLALTHHHDQDIAEHLTSAYRASTNRQAQSVWRKFQNWLPPESSCINRDTVLRFLIYLASELRLNVRTVINYRATLALPLKTAFGIDFSHESFNLLTRSQFLQNPPQLRKIPSWSVNVVLEALSAQRFSIRQAAPKDLFMKTLFLVALASGNRCSELAAMRRTGITLREDHVFIPIDQNFLFKNQSVKNPNPTPISFPRLGSQHTLCPYSNLQKYLALTAPSGTVDAIFLHPSSNVPLQAGRISYWLMQAILSADNTVNKPTGHDIRKIAHSMAFTRGVPLDEIIKNAFWHSPHVFIRKYLCDISPTACKVVAGRST